MAIPDLLRGCPLFHELYDKEIEKIVKYCHVYTVDPGQNIITEGEEGDSIFVIIDGGAMVEKNTPAGKLKIQPLHSGDVFGEMALLGEKVRAADIVATSLSHILEIGYADIFSVFKKEPSIFGLLVLNVTRLMTQRLRSSNKIIADLKAKNENAA